jgi:hypothetical protein
MKRFNFQLFCDLKMSLFIINARFQLRPRKQIRVTSFRQYKRNKDG